MTSYHTHESCARQPESGRMQTTYKQRWVNDRIQVLTEQSSSVNQQTARNQAERDWIEFTNCPF